ncbi:MAG: glycine cleavage system protein GcvH [Bacteroidales bacterium]
MNIPENLKYTKDHEWIKVENDQAYIGITEHAQKELGDIVYIECESELETLEKGAAFGTIEAVKTVADMFMPISGKVLEFNEELEENPETINEDPYEQGWIIKIQITDMDQLQELMTPEQYEAHIS